MSVSRETYLMKLYLDRGARRQAREPSRDARAAAPDRGRWARLLTWLRGRAIR